MILGDSDPELIYLTDGASKGVMQLLQTVIRGSGDGVCKFFFSVTTSVKYKFFGAKGELY